MSRLLDTKTLDGAAKDYAANFIRPSVLSKTNAGVFIAGKGWTMQCLENATFKDEFDYVLNQTKGWMGALALKEFEKLVKELPPREDKVFHHLLREHLAIDPRGNHIEGEIGKVNIGSRIVGKRYKLITLSRGEQLALLKNVYWPIYAGEDEERAAGRIRREIGVGPGADPLPQDPEKLLLPGQQQQANVTNISAEAAIAALDGLRVTIDEGTTAAEIRGRTGAQPADPDAAETGTLLFTLPCSDPAVAAAADDADGTCSATFNSITDDTSADATGTLTYCRVAATGTGADDHFDGNAGTADETFIFNTVAIQSGSTVSMTSAVINLSQGSTAS